jgi:hypothetical protein
MWLLKPHAQFSFEMSTQCPSVRESEIRDFVHDGGIGCSGGVSHRSSDPEVEEIIVLVEPRQPLRGRATAAVGLAGWAAK